MQLVTMFTTAITFATFGLMNILAMGKMPGATATSIHGIDALPTTTSQALDTSGHVTRDTSIGWYTFLNDTTNIEYCIPWPNVIDFSNDTCLPRVDDCYALREWYYQPLILTEYMYVTNFWDSPTAKPPQTWITVHAINTCQLQVRLGGNTSSAFVSALDVANRVNQSIYAGQFEDQNMLTSSGIMACSNRDDGSNRAVTVDWWMGCANTSAAA